MKPCIHIVSLEIPPQNMKLQLLSNTQDGILHDVEVVDIYTPSSPECVCGLQWKMDDGSLTPVKKTDFWTYHPSLTAVVKMDNDLYDAKEKIKQLQSIAVYIADCEAATAGDVGYKKSTSKHEKKRHADICRMTAKSLESGYFTGRNVNSRYTSVDGIKAVIARCNESADICEGKK